MEVNANENYGRRQSQRELIVHVTDDIRATIIEIPSERPAYLKRIEYLAYKQGMIQQKKEIEMIFLEVEAMVKQKDEFLKEDLATILTRLFSKYFREYEGIYHEIDKYNKEVLSLTKQLETINEDITSYGIKTDATLTIEVVNLELVKEFFSKYVAADDNFKVKFMFENKLKETDRFKSGQKQITKFQ
jgi:hypothetical protein